VTQAELGSRKCWFALRTKWRSDLAFPDVIALRDELAAMLHRIRSERHIRPPVIRCSYCGHVGETAEPDVSVKAMILSLDRFGIAEAGEVTALGKRWAASRKQNGLDFCGTPAEVTGAPKPACAHKNEAN